MAKKNKSDAAVSTIDVASAQEREKAHAESTRVEREAYNLAMFVQSEEERAKLLEETRKLALRTDNATREGFAILPLPTLPGSGREVKEASYVHNYKMGTGASDRTGLGEMSQSQALDLAIYNALLAGKAVSAEEIAGVVQLTPKAIEGCSSPADFPKRQIARALSHIRWGVARDLLTANGLGAKEVKAGTKVTMTGVGKYNFLRKQ